MKTRNEARMKSAGMAIFLLLICPRPSVAINADDDALTSATAQTAALNSGFMADRDAFYKHRLISARATGKPNEGMQAAPQHVPRIVIRTMRVLSDNCYVIFAAGVLLNCLALFMRMRRRSTFGFDAMSHAAPSPSARNGMIGKLTGSGRYKIVRQISDGGNGMVFEALEINLNRRASVKCLRVEWNEEIGSQVVFEHLEGSALRDKFNMN